MGAVTKKPAKVVPIEQARRRAVAAAAPLERVRAAIAKGGLRLAVLALLEELPETAQDRELRAVLAAASTFEGTTIDDVVDELERLSARSLKWPSLPLRYAPPSARVRWLEKALESDGLHREWRGLLLALVREWFPELPHARDEDLPARFAAAVPKSTDRRSAIEKALRFAGATSAQVRAWAHRHKPRTRRK